MTTQKHLKNRVRARMAQTGERYAAARRNVVKDGGADNAVGSRGPGRAAHGVHPETSALRSALADLGVTAPHTGRPWTEDMILGLGGGIGIGVFAFHYPAADFSSFYLGARHLWDDSTAFLREAAGRVGVPVEVFETGSTRAAATQLAGVLASGRAAIVSVDLEALGYRGLPAQLSGGGYHHVRVLAFDAAGTALLEDLRDEPIELPAETLGRARARIRSHRQRLIAVGAPDQAGAPPLGVAVRDALRSAADGLDGTLAPAAGGRRGANFSLDGLGAWAKRLHGDRSAEGWARMFPRGHRLWRGLAFVNEFIEHFGTGGGLLRPLYARFLREAGEALGERDLASLADRYDALGRAWSELAASALPADVPAFVETARLVARREEAFLERGPAAADEVRAAWARLAEIEAGMRDAFPLSEAAVDALLAGLQERVRSIEADERAALAALREAADRLPGGGA